MSDKDDSVEMSVEIVTDNNSVAESTKPPEESTDNKSRKTIDNSPVEENADGKEEMGQLKSKIKKLKEKNKEEDQDTDIEIAEGDGTFMCGVVEGFYGRPWTTGQRRELFRRMKAMGMNTYLYGPKDDYKHRLYWRDLYSADEMSLLKLLLDASNEHGILFVYAISPGLDMAFACPKEIECLKNKLLQVQSLGCKAFALLFDDIDPILRATDKARYASAASAQANVTNQMYEVLGGPKFLFCPTEYCTVMAIPDVSNSKYLETIGKELNKNISIMWTGPKVVSKHITVESIRQLTKILRRKVVIWDNIHANDYDPKRMFLGPYKGRSTDLIPHLAGVLTNPNCEFESNYIAMHTLASWWKSYLKQKEKEASKPLKNEDAVDSKKAENDDKKVTNHDVEEAQKGIQEKPEKERDGRSEAKNEVGDVVKGDGGDVEKKEDDAVKAQEKQKDDLPKPPEEPEGNSSHHVSSGVSSLIGSDDSDTDSDYSSHEDYYVLLKHSDTLPFDHGAYNPDESLKEAIRSWLPHFFSSSLPHGKPIARSGPALGALSHCDVGLVSNAPMGVMSCTTSVLANDPISSTTYPNLDSDDAKRVRIEVEHSECENAQKDSVDVTVDSVDVTVDSVDVTVDSVDVIVEGVVVEGNNDSFVKPTEHSDVEMAGATPGASPLSATQVSGRDDKSELEDVKMRSDSDVDINLLPSSSDREKKQEGILYIPDAEDVQMTRVESTLQMETEDDEPMQFEPDHVSDVSMATTLSCDDKKELKCEVDHSESTTELSSVGMMTPPHQTPSANHLPEPDEEEQPERRTHQEGTLPQFKIEPMTREDVEMAVELFYLPYEHGGFGRRMVQIFVWLQSNIRRAVMPPNAPDSVKNESMNRALEWMERAMQFEDYCSSIRRMCNKLISCSNRALLYDLFPYFWDMKGVVSMLSSYVKWMGQFYLRQQPAITPGPPETGSNSSKPASPTAQSPSAARPIAVSSLQMPPLPPVSAWLGTDPEPWAFRGGLSGEFQRLLPIAMANDLFCQAIPCNPPASNTTYTIRPYLASDEKPVYNICLTTGNDGTDFADDFSGYEDLPGERLVGGLLTLSPEYCFVVEDDLGICGYLVGTADAKSFWKKHSIAFWPEVKEKYLKIKSKQKSDVKVGEEVTRLLDEIASEEPPDSYAVDNLYTSHPSYMQIAVHRRVTDPSIAKSVTVCMLSALKSHGIHGVHSTVRSSDCFMPDLYCRLGFREIRPFELSPAVPTLPCISSKEDTFIVFGRTF